jgi:hypothetical protein
LFCLVQIWLLLIYEVLCVLRNVSPNFCANPSVLQTISTLHAFSFCDWRVDTPIPSFCVIFNQDSKFNLHCHISDKLITARIKCDGLIHFVIFALEALQQNYLHAILIVHI